MKRSILNMKVMFLRRSTIERLILIFLVITFIFLLHSSLFRGNRPSLSKKEFSDLMTSRRLRKERVCETAKASEDSRLGNMNTDSFWYHVFYLNDLSILWCPVDNVGITSWTNNLMHLKGLSEEEIEDLEFFYGRNDPIQQMRSLYPELTRTQFDKMLNDEDLKSFFIVQHPFHRLVLSFRRYFERYNNKYYTEYSEYILKQYREKAREVLPRSKFKTALNIDEVEIPLPTFWEFVEYLVDKSDRERVLLPTEWRPVSRLCHVCDIEYAFIIKHEHIQEEQDSLGQNLGFPKHFRFKSAGESEAKLESITRQYFADLTSEQIEKLYDLYRFDFDIFQYEIDGYL